MLRKAKKPKKCKGCKKEYIPSKTTQQACGIKCALRLARIKEHKKLENKWNKEKRDFRINNIPTQKALAQKEFNKWIRRRDKNDGCISCDKESNWHGQWQAGHYKTRGARSDLSFKEDNCHKQCSKCNNFLSGNLVNYREKLIKKIGLERVEALDVRVDSPKMSAQDYADIVKVYRLKIKQG